MTQLLGNWLALGLWSPGALSLERSGDWVRIMQGGDLPDVVLFSAEGNFQTPCPMAGAVSHLRQSQPLLQGKEAIAQTGTGPGPASFPRRQAPCWAEPPHTHTHFQNTTRLTCLYPRICPQTQQARRAWPRLSWGSGTLGVFSHALRAVSVASREVTWPLGASSLSGAKFPSKCPVGVNSHTRLCTQAPQIATPPSHSGFSE